MRQSTRDHLMTAVIVLGISMVLAFATSCGRNHEVQGQQGPAGIDGTEISIVKLYPGVTAYSGVFVEIAMCVNNKLYGVYSKHGGFMTELPPGVYNSNAIGSACNLVVHTNCIVSY